MQIINGYIISSITIKYEELLNRAIWPLHCTLTGTANPGQSRIGFSSNEGLLDTPQISRNEASPSNAVPCHTQHTQESYSFTGI